MSKMVGMNVVIKQSWFKKVAELLNKNFSEEQYKSIINDYLSFEIDSATNLRKAREILMRIWFRDSENVESLQKEGRELAIKYPEQILTISWCMAALVFPAFGDIARLMGKMYCFQDTITTNQIKQKLFDEWGENGTLQTVVSKIIGTMRELGVVKSDRAGSQQIASVEIKNDEIISFMLRVAMKIDNSSYYTISNLASFPTLFPFRFNLNKEYLMQDNSFSFSMFNAELCIAIK